MNDAISSTICQKPWSSKSSTMPGEAALQRILKSVHNSYHLTATMSATRSNHLEPGKVFSMWHTHGRLRNSKAKNRRSHRRTRPARSGRHGGAILACSNTHLPKMWQARVHYHGTNDCIIAEEERAEKMCKMQRKNTSGF